MPEEKNPSGCTPGNKTDNRRRYRGQPRRQYPAARLKTSVCLFFYIAASWAAITLPSPAAAMLSQMQAILALHLLFIILTAIYLTVRRQKNRLTVLQKQYKALTAAYRELQQQNSQLLAINQSLSQCTQLLTCLAAFDPLTELPNRRMIVDHLEFLTNPAGGSRSQFAIAFLDLDNFKIINDSLGHHAGDQALRQVARRLQSAIQAGDMLGRFGGDEFVLIIERPLTPAATLAYVKDITDSISFFCTVEDKEVPVSASFGIAVFPQHGTTAGELLRYADAVMYKNKPATKSRAAVSGLAPEADEGPPAANAR